jgi:hypothetical protein
MTNEEIQREASKVRELYRLKCAVLVVPEMGALHMGLSVETSDEERIYKALPHALRDLARRIEDGRLNKKRRASVIE